MKPTSNIKLHDGIWEAWVTYNDTTKLIHIGTEIPCQQNTDLLIARIQLGDYSIWDNTFDYDTLCSSELDRLKAMFR